MNWVDKLNKNWIYLKHLTRPIILPVSRIEAIYPLNFENRRAVIKIADGEEYISDDMTVEDVLEVLGAFDEC